MWCVTLTLYTSRPYLIDRQEPECCDGSDERAGVCKNTCKEIGEVYRAKQEAERKLRKTVCYGIITAFLDNLTGVVQGSKIRASYIAFAQKEKKRLEAAIIAGDEAIASQQREVDRLKGTCTSAHAPRLSSPLACRSRGANGITIRG